MNRKLVGAAAIIVIAAGGIYIWENTSPRAVVAGEPDRQECGWAASDFHLWVSKKPMEYHRTEDELNADMARCQAAGLINESGTLID